MTLKTFFPVLINSFNSCLFISLILLSFFEPFVFYYQITTKDTLVFYGLIPFLNSLLSIAIIYLLNRFLSKHKYLHTYQESQHIVLIIIAFITGFSCLFINTTIGSIFFGLIVLILTALKIKDFIHTIAQMLPANRLVTPKDLGEFFSFFIDLIIFFTVINLIFRVPHYSYSHGTDFNIDSSIDYIFNTLYFTVVTMTTVGYGDYTPTSYLGKMLVVVECLTSYIMFGLMIGIISRGVEFGNNKTLPPSKNNSEK